MVGVTGARLSEADSVAVAKGQHRLAEVLSLAALPVAARQERVQLPPAAGTAAISTRIQAGPRPGQLWQSSQDENRAAKGTADKRWK